MASREIFNVVVYLILFAWMTTGLNMPIDEKLEDLPGCNDTVPDCMKYDGNKVCDNIAFALISCRKYCKLCDACSIPNEHPKNGTLTLLMENNMKSFKLNYTCNDGYYVSRGNLSRTCENGSWSGTLPVCSPVLGSDCNENATCEKLLPGSTCYNTKCSCSYNYSQFHQKCFKDCGNLSAINFTNVARVYLNDTTYTSEANISCDTGYTVKHQAKTKGISTTIVTCSENGTWDNIPICVEKDCGDVHNITLNNASERNLRDNDTTYNSTAEVLCDKGYYDTEQNQTTGRSKATIRCSDTGEWIKTPNCVRKNCGPVASLHINNTASVDFTPLNETIYESVALVKCKTGHVVSGSNNSQMQFNMSCGINGTWNNVKDCVRIDCGNISKQGLKYISTHVTLHTDTRYNSTAEVNCKEGYYNSKQNQTEGISTTTMTCSSNGSWYNKPTCEIKDCGPVASLHINNTASVDFTPLNETTYESVALVKCKTGHVLSGSNNSQMQFNMSCGINGTWNNVKDCVRIDCGNISKQGLKYISTHVTLHTDTRYNSTAEVNCKEGYYNSKQNQTEGISTTTMTCSSNGSWYNKPTCEIKDCGPVASLHINNTASVDLTPFNKTKFESVASVKCKTGHVLSALNNSQMQFNMSCGPNGTWNNVKDCIRIDCGNISKQGLQNINTHVTLHTDTRYNSTAEVNCKEGYYNSKQDQTEGISTTTMTCSSNGSWDSKPTCEIKDCGPLEDLNITNHELLLIFSNTKVGARATITCKDGYYDNRKTDQPEGTSSTLISCSVNGTWSNLPNCTRKDCGEVYNITIDHADNRRVHNDTKYRSTADIDCDEGYYIKGQQQPTGISTKTISCSNTGHWNYTPNCIPKDCGKLENINISNADNRAKINGTIYNATAHVSCNVGFKEENETQMLGISSTLIRCNENGSWTDLPTCVRKDCGPVKNLNLTKISNVSLHNDTKYGSTANVSCEEGYYDKNKTQTTHISTTTIRCSEEGHWIDLPFCVRKDCGPLGNLDKQNANNRTLTLKNDTKFNSTATVQCNIGYTKEGQGQVVEGISSTEIRCNISGIWSNIPTCVKKDCGNVTNLNISNAKTRHQNNGTKYESTAEIVCDDGYYDNVTQTNTTSITSITCSASGKWQTIPTCVPKNCGTLEKPSNGNVSFTNTLYNSTATYLCDTGYEIIGNKSVTCQETGHWSSNTTKCKIKDCGRLAAPENGNITFSENNTTYGSNAKFSCNAGYNITGPETILCKDTGHWSDNTTTCVIKDCGPPNKLENGNFATPNGTTYEASAFYECNPGYTLHGSNSTKCLNTGIWENKYMNCTLNKCPRSANITNGNSSVNSSHASYWCNIGYTLHGYAELFCLLNVSWNTNPPTCNVTDCGFLQKPDNGNVTHGNTTYNSIRTFTCNDGYDLTDNGTSVCNASGNWSSQPSCKIKDCGNLTDPLFGHVDQSNGTTFQSVSTYSCDTGYTLKERNTTKCTKDGKWDNINVTCEINDCGQPSNISHGNVTISNGTTYESFVTYTCNEGYYTNDLTIRYCQADKTWNGTDPTCTIKDCGNLTAPKRGYVDVNNGTVYQSVARYSCETGYTLYGDNITQCLSSGNWSKHELNCTINDCDLPGKPDKGNVTKINGTTYLSIAKYSCEEGYDLNGNDTRVCQANKTWSLALPTCDIVDCGPPNKTSHGSINTTNGTTYLSQIIYSCDTGYDLKGPKTATCQADKTWTSVNQSCEIKHCSTPTQPQNGEVKYDSKHVNYNDNATYTCKIGYRLKGPMVVTCDSNGNWSHTPYCVDIDECADFTSDCHIRATCTNTNGSFTCQCQAGFNDVSFNQGRKCEDIDECSSENTNFCNKDGSNCVNYNGGFVCVCYEGWTGGNCTEDIDECKSETTCGPHAYCTNYDGGYNCTCDDKYPQGDPKIHCYEKVIIDLLSHTTLHRGDNQLIDAKPIKYLFPYFGMTFNSFRASMNGFLTLGYQPLYENYGAENSGDWKKFSSGHTVIAPFWTDIDSTNLTGGVEVHLVENYTNYGTDDDSHKDLHNLGDTFSNVLHITDFKPRVAIVVTWRNVTQASYIEPIRLIRRQNATMQAILISDGVYSYLMFNYDHEQWSFKMEDNIPSSAGYSNPDNTGFILATSENYTLLNKDSNVTPKLAGRWMFNVSSTDEDKNKLLRNESECLKFIYNDTIKTWIKKHRELSYACPCSEQQMQLDYSYHTVDPMYEHSNPKPICYEAWFFNNDGVKQTCCYSFGALKKDNVGGGFATFEKRPYITDYFYKCCSGDRHLCHLYYEMNPSDDCSRFNPADEPFERKRRSALEYFSGGRGQHVFNYWFLFVTLLLVRLDLS